MHKIDFSLSDSFAKVRSVRRAQRQLMSGRAFGEDVVHKVGLKKKVIVLLIGVVVIDVDDIVVVVDIVVVDIVIVIVVVAVTAIAIHNVAIAVVNAIVGAIVVVRSARCSKRPTARCVVHKCPMLRRRHIGTAPSKRATTAHRSRSCCCLRAKNQTFKPQI